MLTVSGKRRDLYVLVFELDLTIMITDRPLGSNDNGSSTVTESVAFYNTGKADTGSNIQKVPIAFYNPGVGRPLFRGAPFEPVDHMPVGK